MVAWIALIMWIIIIPTIIIVISKKNINKKLVLIISQIYNFVVGFSGFALIFIITMVNLGTIQNKIIFYIMQIFIHLIVFSILLIPVNKAMKKRITMQTSSYVILSTFVIGLGFLLFYIGATI